MHFKNSLTMFNFFLIGISSSAQKNEKMENFIKNAPVKCDESIAINAPKEKVWKV